MAWTDPRTWVAGELVDAPTMNVHLRDNLDAIASVGSYKFVMAQATAVETIIDGAWLECNGFAVSRTTYADLHAKVNSLGYPWGAGDGATTFNVPDASGRAPWTAGGRLALGATDGVAAANRSPRHRHTPHAHYVNSITRGITDPTNDAWQSNPDGASVGVPTSAVDGGSGVGSDPLDAPAHVVMGVWAVKF